MLSNVAPSAAGPGAAAAAALAEIVRGVQRLDAAIAAAEAGRVRLLHEAWEYAEAMAAEQRPSVAAQDMALRSVAWEIAAATNASDRSLQRQITEAATLVRHYPDTLTAREAGAISRAHVRQILEAGAHLPGRARPAFDVVAAAIARTGSPARARARILAAAEAAHPRTVTERHRDARETRTVRVIPGADGMSQLIATLPTPLARAVEDRLQRMSRVIMDARRDAARAPSAPGASTDGSRTGAAGDDPHGANAAGDDPHGANAAGADGDGANAAGADPHGANAAGADGDGANAAGADPHGANAAGADGHFIGPAVDDASATERTGVDAVTADTRTADQIRADVLTDLLLSGTPALDPTATADGPGTLGAIRARVQITIPALSMLRPARENLDPAELVGHGPIDLDLARRIAQATSTPWDRVITHPATGAVLHTDTYHRTAAIDRFIRARDRTCRAPGCALPAVSCEVDHTEDYARGGPTVVANLATLCQRHHSMKQFTAWRVEQLPGGVLRWTSPAGYEYTDRPLPYPRAPRFQPDCADEDEREEDGGETGDDMGPPPF
ncbi:DUF222 domain-containing protein [Microbacterium sp. LMI1-1-1.1]|uniref:DUF222 domain-containing protein n=1 Tax=Microbacterium sp. LMI1-1-1.1 TaxID=3135223 RepID=UPI003467DEBC